jgi:4-hydroxy-tetrahydrodipicolinate synthase
MSTPAPPFAGLFAAAVTPTGDDGRLDLARVDRLVDFLVEAGVSGICIGGATGEYPHFETEDRSAVIRRAAARMPRGSALLVGIGAPSRRHVLELGHAAIDAGAAALLLPMPMFFRYAQEDLEAFSIDVTDALRAPCLLYNLPAFTNGLAAASVLNLLRTGEFIAGVKDSSGDVKHLATFAEARRGQRWSLFVGDDRILRLGLEAGWDGGISGIAGFCPELVVGIYRSYVENRLAEAARLQGLLDELIDRIAVFPTPWGIRIGLSARGIPNGPLPLPVTPGRRRQIEAFTEWLPAWLQRTGLAHNARSL